MDSVEYYNQNAVDYYDRTVNLGLEEVMEPFLELLPENAEILDMGCGSGRDTLVFEEAGFSVTAMDGAEEMCKLASIHTDMDILHLTYEEMDFQDVFQGIWACASLVHVPYRDMKKILGKVLEALKSEGVLYFSVREGEQKHFEDAREYYDYSKESMKKLLKGIRGIQVLDIWTTRDVREEEVRWLHVLIRKED